MEKRLRIGNYSVNTQWIHYGTTSDTIIVFLHEALGSIVQWKTFPETVCNQLHLPGIVIERRGHGQSDALEEPRTEQYLHRYMDETKAVLDALLPLETKILLVGHSDGGTISLLYARYHPKNCIGVCTMAAHTFVEAETLAGIDPAVAAFESGKLDGLRRIHGEKTDTLFYAWANTWRAPFFHNWDIREEIKGIRCPVLAIQGTNDQYGTEEQLASIAAAGPEIQTALIADCGHHPHIEKPEKVLILLNDWFSAIQK